MQAGYTAEFGTTRLFKKLKTEILQFRWLLTKSTLWKDINGIGIICQWSVKGRHLSLSEKNKTPDGVKDEQDCSILHASHVELVKNLPLLTVSRNYY